MLLKICERIFYQSFLGFRFCYLKCKQQDDYDKLEYGNLSDSLNTIRNNIYTKTGCFIALRISHLVRGILKLKNERSTVALYFF